MNVIFKFLIFGSVLIAGMPDVLAQSTDLLIQYDSVPVSINDRILSMSWGGGINSAQLNHADLDLDGIDELIVLDRNSQQIHIYALVDDQYLNKPDFISLLPPINRNWVVFADYDCDGNQDIFNYRSGGIVVYRNISDGERISWEKVADPLKTVGFSGSINLVVNSADIPAIQDVDGDGDLDILSYNFALGEDILFHQNMSVERTGNCGELDFEITNRQWGEFKECDCHTYAFDGLTCAEVSSGRVAHTGGKSLLTRDMDGDMDPDLFLSHSDCNDLIFFYNVGDLSNPLFTGFQSEFPSQTDPVSIPIYPVIKFLDVDSDQVEDFISSPNIDFNFEFNSDFSSSLWQYSTVGSGNTEGFQLVKKDFLQEDLIDLGELSQPVFFDIDADGDADLLVAANGKETSGIFYGYVSIFENAGNRFVPEFKLVDTNFLELVDLQLHIPKIRLVDLNEDGVKDFFYCGYDYQQGVVKSFIYYNRADAGQPMDFSNEFSEEVSLPLTLFDNPEFSDVDDDGDPDLLIGKRSGALDLYTNRGSLNFELAENDYLGIGRDFTLTKLNVFPQATDFNNDGREDLLIADTKEISVYDDFKNQSEPLPQILRTYNYYTDAEDSISMQVHNSIATRDLFGTGFQSLIIGGSGGGLRYYRLQREVDNPDDVVSDIVIYPNPVQNSGYVKIESLKAGVLTIYSLWGQRIKELSINEKSVTQIDTYPLAAGVYVLFFESFDGSTSTKKLLITK